MDRMSNMMLMFAIFIAEHMDVHSISWEALKVVPSLFVLAIDSTTLQLSHSLLISEDAFFSLLSFVLILLQLLGEFSLITPWFLYSLSHSCRLLGIVIPFAILLSRTQITYNMLNQMNILRILRGYHTPVHYTIKLPQKP